MMGRMIRWNEKSIWRIVNAAILTVVGALGCGRTFGIFSFGLWHILTALAAFLVLTLWDHVSIRGRITGLAGVAVLLTGAGAAVGLQNCLSFFRSYGRWLAGSPAQQPEWAVGFELLQTLVLVLVCYFLRILMEKDFRLQLVGTLVVMAVLPYALFTEKELPKTCVAFLLCYALLTCAEWTQIRWKKEKGRGREAYMLWILPFAVVYFLLIMVPSVPENPYDWQIVKNVYRQLRESLTKLSRNIASIGDEEYDLSLSGFSGRGQIGGDLREDDHEIMRIFDSNGLVTNVYLSGKVYDTFDGRGWKQTDQDSVEERYLDTIGTVYALRAYDNQFFTDYLRYAHFKVEYRYFRSEYLFLPLKAMSVMQDGKSLTFRQEGGSLFFDRAKGYGTEYEVSFYQMNGGRAAFDRFLEEAGQAAETVTEADSTTKETAGTGKGFGGTAKENGSTGKAAGMVKTADQEMLDSLFRELKRKTGMEISPEALEIHRQSVYEHYMEKVTVSDETQKYLDGITAGAETDLEKLRAIETALNGFSYTLSPGQLPGGIKDGGDFLDYFLLESRKGYCSHFATAFTLLARKEGFPARYVQGFCVPVSGEGETMVYSHMAHAWPEVYLDGIGWIPFEPTPGYSEVRYRPWTIRGSDTLLDDEGEGVSGNAGEKKEAGTKQQFEEIAAQTLSGKNGETGETEKEIQILTGQNVVRLLKISGVAVLAVVCGIAIVLVLNRLAGLYRYRKMKEKEKLRTEVYQNMQILSLLGIRREEETLEEFRLRAERMLSEKECLQFLESYEEILYGSRKADRNTLEIVICQQRQLEGILKKRKRGAYIYYLLFLIRSR